MSIVILALARRLKVVPSLKVMPSEEVPDVATSSLAKMSSRICSGVAVLLRVTVAVPVSVATLPIGSGAAGCALAAGAGVAGAGVAGAGVGGVALGAGAGACAGCACASRVKSGAALAADCQPIVTPAPSRSAKRRLRRIAIDSRGRQWGRQLSRVRLNAG
ncbi:hypothetical protein ACVIWU_002050 [Bradyrhizobium sp. USDA 4509]